MKFMMPRPIVILQRDTIDSIGCVAEPDASIAWLIIESRQFCLSICETVKVHVHIGNHKRVTVYVSF